VEDGVPDCVEEAVPVCMGDGELLAWKASSILSTSSEEVARESPKFLTRKVRVCVVPAGSQAEMCSQPEVIMSPNWNTLRSAMSCSTAAP
jgi:hypothetical protein